MEQQGPYREGPGDLRSMSAESQRLLVQLVRLVAHVDGQVDDSERAEVARIADQMGEQTFWQLMEQTPAPATDSEIREAARQVSSLEERELIYGALYELSLCRGIHESEGRVLDELARIWDLEVSIGPPD